MTDTSGFTSGFADSSNNAVDTNWQADVYKNALYLKQNPGAASQYTALYPQYAWMFSDPGLAALAYTAFQNNWTAATMSAALSSNSWWQQNGESVMNYKTQQIENPQGLDLQVSQMQTHIQAMATAMGVNIPASLMSQYANQATEFAWSDTMIQQNLAGQYQNQASAGTAGTPTGGYAATFDAGAQAMLQNYAVPVSASELAQWTAKAMTPAGTTGTPDVQGALNGFQEYLMQQASQLYPWMAKSIASGITPTATLSPYASVANQLLGVSTQGIDWTDPKYQSALVQPGAQTPVSVQQFATTLRTDPTFGYSKTPTAIANAYQTADQIGQAMGKVAG